MVTVIMLDYVWCLGTFLQNSYTAVIDQNKLILLLVILVLSLLYLWNGTCSNLPPGPRGYPFIGNLYLWKDKPHLHLTHLREKYGDIVHMWLGRYRVIAVSSFDGIQEALLSQAHMFSDRPNIFCDHRSRNESGITFADFSMEYKVKKDCILRGIDNLCSTNDNIEDVLLGEVEKFVLLLLSYTKPFDPALILESTVLRLMLYLVNGKMYKPNDDNFLEIWKTFQLQHDITGDLRVFFPLMQKLDTHLYKEISERFRMQQHYQRNIVNRHKDCFNPEITCDLVDHMLVMLEQNEDMGLLDQDQLDSLLIEISGAGYRTLAVTLRWLVLYIAYFTDVQDKVYEELISVIGRDRLPTLSDQPFLPYTCAVILETHRLASVMPFLYPHRTRDHTSLKDYDIPKDSIILFNVWSLHHDPKLWKQPMKFDPTRFLTDDCTSLYIPDHFLPFGEGVRSCPGESITDILLFLFTSHLLYQLQISLSDTVELEGTYRDYILTPKPFRIVSKCRDTLEPCPSAHDKDAGTYVV